MCPCDVACKTVRLVEIPWQSCATTPPHAVPYMLRRCVGFSWAKPSVTKSATHLPVFLVFKSPVLRAAPFLSILRILWFLNPHAVLRATLAQTSEP